MTNAKDLSDFVLSNSLEAQSLAALLEVTKNEEDAERIFKTKKYDFVPGSTDLEQLGKYIFSTDEIFKNIRINCFRVENYFNFSKIGEDLGKGFKFTKYGAIRVKT